MYDNFNVLQFQRAREARQRKNSIQFQRRNNFDVLGSDIYSNFDVLTISMFHLFEMYDNFNVLQFRRAREARQRKNGMQFRRSAISTVLVDLTYA